MGVNLIRMILAGLLILSGGAFVYATMQPAVTEVDSFEECKEAGYPVRESNPRVCTTFEGDSFTEERSG